MHRILIIDDSEFDRRMMALAMKSTGLNLEYIELNNGSTALETIREKSPAVTLLDIRMPGKSGFDVLKDIRQDSTLSDHTVILVSGSDAACDHNQAKELKASGYYMKPHTRKDYQKIALEISETFLEQAA